MSAEVMSPSGKAAAVLLPNERDGYVKLPPKYLCLHPFNAALCLGYGNFFIQWVAISGETTGWSTENKWLLNAHP